MFDERVNRIMSTGRDLITAIRMNRGAHDDTLYCNNFCKKQILDTINSSGSFRTSDSVQVEGLEVETHEVFTVPVSCKKGDIFPLAEDYKE